MKLIKPSVEFFGKVPTDYDSSLKFIEMAGRTCYKSEDKITDTSAEKFVKKLILAGHLAMIEHSNFVVKYKFPSEYVDYQILPDSHYLKTDTVNGAVYIGGNLRAWAEYTIKEGIPYFCDSFILKYGELFGIKFDDCIKSLWEVCPHEEIPHGLHRFSAKFICNRAVSHELVRHRPCSFAQESQRYVNYGGKDMEFIEPIGLFPGHLNVFERVCEECERTYNTMVEDGLKPQQARAVLPNAAKTEIVVTADAAEWGHIKKLRTAKGADPEMQRVMNMMPWEEIVK